MSKLALNYINKPKYSFLYTVFLSGLLVILMYALWERSYLLNDIDENSLIISGLLVDIEKINNAVVKQKPISDTQLKEAKYIKEISRELNIPWGEMLDVIQIALVPKVKITKISLEDETLTSLEGIVQNDDALRIYVEKLMSNPNVATVEVLNQMRLDLDNKKNTSDDQLKTKSNYTIKFQLMIKWVSNEK